MAIEKIYKYEDLQSLSRTKSAIKDVHYKDDKGNEYIGTDDKSLIWLQKAKDVPLGDIQYITSANVQDAIKELADKTTQIEVDFGPLPIYGKEFTILDSRVKVGSLITAEVAYDTPTGKELDEIEADDFVVKAGSATVGSFKLFINTSDGSYLHDKFKVNYHIK
jgi:hypothetical protein